MAPIIRQDPYPAYGFRVSVKGIATDGKLVNAAFTEVSGLDMTIPPIAYRNGNDLLVIRQMTGVPTRANVVLKRGITGHVEFWTWIRNAMNGDVLKTDVAITLLSENQQEVMRWNISKAWPTSFKGPALNAANNEIAMETVELAVETIEIG